MRIYRKHQQSKKNKAYSTTWSKCWKMACKKLTVVLFWYMTSFCDFIFLSFGWWNRGQGAEALKPGQSVWRNSKSPYLSRDASLRLNSIVNIDSEKKQLVSEYKGIDTWKWQSTSLLVSCSGTKIIVGSTMYSLQFTISHHQQYNIILM